MWSPRDDDHPRIAVNFFVVEKIAIMRQQHAVLAPSISVHFSVVAASEADVAHKERVVAPLAEELRDLGADIFVNRKMCLVSEPGTEVRWIWERTPQHRNDFHKSVCGENREKADYSNFPVSVIVRERRVLSRISLWFRRAFTLHDAGARQFTKFLK